MGRTPEFITWCLLALRLYDLAGTGLCPLCAPEPGTPEEESHVPAGAVRTCLRKFLLVGLRPRQGSDIASSEIRSSRGAWRPLCVHNFRPLTPMYCIVFSDSPPCLRAGSLSVC